MSAFAQSTGSALAANGSTVVTQRDHRAYHLPLDDRGYSGTIRDPQQVSQILAEIINGKMFKWNISAVDALNDNEKRFAAISADRAQLTAALSIVERRAKDRAIGDADAMDKRAREIYQVTDASSLKREFAADFQHVLFDLRAREFTETAQRISQAQADLAAGKSFDEVVATFSDEARSKDTKGKFENVQAKTMDGVLARVLFDELKDGEVSKPLPSRLGIHIVKRLAVREPQKRPYEEVKDALVARIVDEAGKSAKADLLKALQPEKIVYDTAAIQAVTGVVDPAVLKKAQELARELSKSSQLSPSEPTPTQQKK